MIALAQRLERYEIAGYGCARTLARRLNRPDEARLLLETLEEEGREAAPSDRDRGTAGANWN